MKGLFHRYGLILFLGLPLVFALGLGLVDLQQVQARKEAYAQAERSRIILRRPIPDIPQVEATLAKAQAEVRQVAGLFSQEGSDALVSALLERARQHRLSLTSITARVPVRQEEGKTSSIPVSFRLSGQTPDFLAFLASLDYPSLEVQGASIAEESGGGLSLEVDFLIHTLPQEQG